MSLFAALYIHAARSLPDPSPETLLEAADTWFGWTREAATDRRKHRLFASIGDAAKLNEHATPLRIVATVTSASPRRRERHPASERDRRLVYSNAQQFEICDRIGDKVPTLPLVDRSMLEALVRAERSGQPMLVDARLLALPRDGVHGGTRPYVLAVDGIEPARTRLARAAATDDEIAAAKALARKHAGKTGGLAGKVAALVQKHVSIVPRERVPIMGTLLDVLVAQLFSGGRVGKSSGAIQAVLVGPPGVGKQTGQDVARFLHDPYVGLLASGVNEVSLLGRSVQTPFGYTLERGHLDRADDGVLGIEDMQFMPAAVARKLADVFNAVASTGRLPAGKSGSRARTYSVRLVVDANPEALVAGTHALRGRPRGARLHEMFPFIGRCDGVFVFAPSEDLQWELADATLSLEHVSDAARKTARSIHVLAAFLHDRHPSIDLAPVRNAERAALARLKEHARASTKGLPAGLLQPTRVALTLSRFTAASARMADRSRATAADVAWAEGMARARIDGVVALFGGEDSGAERQKRAGAWRVLRLAEVHPGKVLTIDQMCKALAKLGVLVAVTTMRREVVKANLASPAWGKFRLPPRPRSGVPAGPPSPE